MGISFIEAQGHRFFLGVIIALAFFVQSIIPAGYMPQFHAGKIFEITICHGDNITKVAVDEQMRPVKNVGGSHDNHGKSSNHFKTCPYAAISFKCMNLATFLYHYTDKLTYERAVERTLSPFVSYIFYPPYEGRAPPYPLA